MFRRKQSSENSPEIPLAAKSYPRDQPFSHSCGVVCHIRSSPRGFARRQGMSGICDVGGGQTGNLALFSMSGGDEFYKVTNPKTIGKLRRNDVLYPCCDGKSRREPLFRDERGATLPFRCKVTTSCECLWEEFGPVQTAVEISLGTKCCEPVCRMLGFRGHLRGVAD